MKRRSLLAATSTALVGSMAGCLSGDPAPLESWTPDPGSWPLMSYDVQNTSFNPNASPPRNAPTSSWERSVDGAIHGLLAMGDVLIAFGETGIWGISAEDGDILWSHGSATLAAGIYGDDVFSSHRIEEDEDDPTGRLRALDVYSGDERFSTSEFGSNPRLTDILTTEEYVIVGDRWERESRVFTRASGDHMWTVEPGVSLGLMRDRLVATGRRNLSIYTLESDWRSTDLEEEAFTRTVSDDPMKPACSEFYIYSGDFSFRTGGRRASVNAYDGSFGHKLWSNEPRGVLASTPAILDEIGFAVQSRIDETGSVLVGLDLLDGGERFHVPIDGNLRRVIATSDLLLAWTERTSEDLHAVMAFDHDGNEQWVYSLNSHPGHQSGVIVMDETLYIGTLDGKIMALTRE